MTDHIEAVRAHVERHAGKERATFSIAGVKALLAAADTALPAAPMPGVKATVRALEWEVLGNGRWQAGHYSVWHQWASDGRFHASVNVGRYKDTIIGDGYAELSEAKAAAQADYVKRILSALDVPAHPEGVKAAMIEKMRDDPFIDDAHLLGTTQQDKRMEHYAGAALSTLSHPEPVAQEAVARELQQLREYAKAATIAITGLTGVGSEYFGKQIGDIYTADLDFCVKRIRESREAANQRWKDAVRAAKATSDE